MKIISVNVSGVRMVEWDGQQVATGIFKAPVEGRARVGRLNLEGDRRSGKGASGNREKPSPAERSLTFFCRNR